MFHVCMRELLLSLGACLPVARRDCATAACVATKISHPVSLNRHMFLWQQPLDSVIIELEEHAASTSKNKRIDPLDWISRNEEGRGSARAPIQRMLGRCIRVRPGRRQRVVCQETWLLPAMREAITMGIPLSLSIRCKREANSAFLATKKHLLAVTGLGH